MKKILNDKKEEMLQYEWKDYISILYWCVSYIYMELIFHIAIFGKVDSNILFPLPFWNDCFFGCFQYPTQSKKNNITRCSYNGRVGIYWSVYLL